MGLLLVIAKVSRLPSSLRLLSAHCPGAGFLTPPPHELSHAYAVRTAVPPPPTNAETRKTSWSTWTPENVPLELRVTFCWKNQAPMLASPLTAKRSPPITTTLFPLEIAAAPGVAV